MCFEDAVYEMYLYLYKFISCNILQIIKKKYLSKNLENMFLVF